MLLRVILIAILLLLIARAFWRVVDGIMEGAGAKRRREVEPGVELVRDPMCGTFVAPRSALTLTAAGRTHHFCSETCREKFRKGKA